jgi:hypothetical protein
MWNWLLTRIAARAMPPDISDPSLEFLASTAAENAARYTARLAGILVLLLLLAVGWLLYRDASSGAPRPEVSQAARESSRVAGELWAENARLQQSVTDLQRKVDDLTAQRDALQAKLDSPAATPAAPADAAAKPGPAPAATPEPAPAAKAEPPAAKPEPAPGPVRQATAPPPRKREPAGGEAPPRERLEPSRITAAPAKAAASVRAEDYRCGDGRTVSNPAECRAVRSAPPAGPPAAGAFACGDGRAVSDPADCRPAGEAAADDLRPRRGAP